MSYPVEYEVTFGYCWATDVSKWQWSFGGDVMENPAAPNVSALQSDSWSCLQHQSHVMFTRERVSAFQRFLFAFLGPFKWHSLSQTLCSHHSGFSLLKGLLLELCSSPACSSFPKHFLPGSSMHLICSLLQTSQCRYFVQGPCYYPRATWVQTLSVDLAPI